MPQKSRTKPPMERIKADISCKSSLINRVIFQNSLQIYTKKGTICKFSSQFSAKFLATRARLLYQAYRRKVSILASETGCPVISRKRSINSCRCLVGMFCRARWLSLSWISCVVIAIDDWTIDDWTKVVYYGNGSRLVRERFENDSVKMRKNGHNSRS